MEEREFQNDVLQRFVHQTNPLVVDVPHLNTSLDANTCKKPPSYPHNPSHSRSLSQPAFLPPSTPLPSSHPDAPLPPPRKAHRRSSSDTPFSIQPLPPLVPAKSQLVKEESDLDRGVGERKSQENGDDLDSRASGTKTDSSENEAESNTHTNVRSLNGTKRNAAEDSFPATRHCRSVSMDSFMGNLPSFGGESSATFSMEFGNGEFNAAELKKIMGNEKLAEIALIDPKRVKRILANRQSAARSKERKVRYISELEHKVQTLESEATTLAAQLTLLQRDSAGLTNQNNELKFRLQAMEQQAHLRDALNEALSAEVKRLKLATGEYGGQVHTSNSAFSKQMFHTQHQQQQQCEMSSGDNISVTKPDPEH